MLIEYAILGGIAGAQTAKAVDTVVLQKRKSDIKDSINRINTLLDDIKKSLVGLGILKTSCLQHELISFLDLYNTLLEDTEKKEIWNQITDDLSDMDKKALGNRLKKAIEFGPKCIPTIIEGDILIPFPLKTVFLLKRAKEKSLEERILVGCATFGIFSYSDAHYLEKSIKTNKTVQWFTYPLFKNYISINNQEPVYNDLIEDIILAATAFPHSFQTDSVYRKVLKNEDERRELALKIENACIPLEYVKSKIIEVGNAIEAETLQLRQINERMAKISRVRNNTDYSNNTCAEIIILGITLFRDLLVLMNTPLFEQKGYFSEELQSFLDDEDFKKRVVSEIDFGKFDKYYQEFVNVYSVNESDLSAYNIKIINSELHGNKTKYYYFYKDGDAINWTECPESSSLCYVPLFTNLKEDSLLPLIKLLRDDMSMGILQTTIYYYGNKELFDNFSQIVTLQYKNIKTKYMGDGRYEK